MTMVYGTPYITADNGLSDGYIPNSHVRESCGMTGDENF